MEITVNIPKNDYVQPTEVRPEVVQAICEAFLNGGAWGTFYPFSGSVYRPATRLVEVKCGKGVSFVSQRWNLSEDEIYYRIYGCEMKAAFEALIKAGYHLFKVYDHGSWVGYVCKRKPYRENGTEVYEFTDFID